VQDVSVDVPPVRSSRDRAVGRNKRKADSSLGRDDDAERQAKLEQALLQQLDMQKKLHEQLEVLHRGLVASINWNMTLAPDSDHYASRWIGLCPLAPPCGPDVPGLQFIHAHQCEELTADCAGLQAQRQLQMRLELHQQHITAMLKV
jgi:hypothetical protein